MADFRNNAITNDTNDQHTLRVDLCVVGMAKFEVELGFRGGLVAQMTKHQTDWNAATQDLTDQHGDELAATALLNQLEAELHDMLVSARWMVESMLYEDDVQGVEEHDIRCDFGLDKSIPFSHPGQLAIAKKMVSTNERYIADVSPYALPAAPFDAMKAKYEAFDDAIETRSTEKHEELHAGKVKEIERANGDRLLARAFKWICAIWDDNDDRLLEFGFVPKSQIWTPAPFPAPKNLAYDEPTATTSWDAVEGADSYQLDYRLNGASGDWTTLYEGVDNFTTNKPPDPGEYDFRVRAIAEGKLGAWSGVLEVNFSGGALVGVPTGFKFDDVKQEFSWDWLELALVYELEISRDEGQTWLQKYQDVDTYFDASLFDPGKALARVRAIDGYFEPGEWSDPPLAVQFKLRTPTMLMYDQYRNQFTCDFVPGAEGYEFEIDDGIIGWVQVYKGPNNHFVHDLHDGYYKARVRAYRGAENSDWSHTIEVAIIFVMPKDLEYNGGAKRIDWKKVADAKLYHLVNETGTISYIGADNHFDIVLTAPEKFRVRAGDDSMQVWGEWSAWTMLG